MRSIPAAALAAALAFGSLAGPASAQRTPVTLEDAWSLCARMAEQPDVVASLAREAPAAGFPLMRAATDTSVAAYGARDAANGLLTIAAMPENMFDPASCNVTQAGGELADLAARAEPFWRARGLKIYSSNLFSAGSDRPGLIEVALIRREGQHAHYWTWQVFAPVTD